MPVVITGNNTPTAGGVTYGDGTTYANTAAGTSGQALLSNGASAPTWGTPAASTATTATNLAGGSNGTIPYQSAAGTTQMLAVGTAGQVLQTNGAGAPTWVTPSAGAVSFVSAVTASAASTVSFTGLTSTPAYYFIEFDGLISSTNDGLECYLSINNGSSYISSGYRYTFIFSEAATSSTVSSTGSTVGVKIILADSPPSSNANYPSKGIVRILGAGAPRASIQSEITIITATANVNHNVGAAMPDTASGVNAIKFQGASGTITGNFRLYSVSKT